ncbi:hypothetical protein niasHS_015265 [Heterodera schachtii]|uniref:Uncharacterized protein n=1 Tax=Heterodera schachtii TaxID=97005 RepID=A0ABD2I9B9_HETSC
MSSPSFSLLADRRYFLFSLQMLRFGTESVLSRQSKSGFADGQLRWHFRPFLFQVIALFGCQMCCGRSERPTDRLLEGRRRNSFGRHRSISCHSFCCLGFVRAMFVIAASASSHTSNNSEWQALSAQFGQQISEIDSKCAEFGIGIAKVPFDGPKGDHSQRNVPGTDSVISMPGLTGSHKQ